MTTRFAGSRCLDERRRRRLAQESAPTRPDKPAPAKPTPQVSEDPLQEPEAAPVPLARRPSASLLPQSLWKTVLLITAIFAAGASVIAFGYLCDTETSPLRRIASLSRGSLPRFFSTLCLLASSQLSLLIFWHRAQSRKDFSGRYRIWSWSGLFWMVMCLGVATDLHRLLARDLLKQWPADLWAAEELCWLTPVAIGHLALVRLLSLEMQQSPASRWFLRLSLVASAASAASVCLVDTSTSDRLDLAIVTGVSLLWQTALLVSLLLHARFVTFTTNEPAPLRQPGWKKLTRKMLECVTAIQQRLREKRAAQLARVEAARLESENEASQPETASKPTPSKTTTPSPAPKPKASTQADTVPPAAQDESANKPAAKSRKKRKKSTSAPVTHDVSTSSNRKVRIDRPQLEPPSAHSTTTAPAGDSSADDVRATPEERENATPKRRPAPPKAPPAVEDDLDEQDLSHLSRKERRRLRKKQRAGNR